MATGYEFAQVRMISVLPNQTVRNLWLSVADKIIPMVKHLENNGPDALGDLTEIFPNSCSRICFTETRLVWTSRYYRQFSLSLSLGKALTFSLYSTR